MRLIALALCLLVCLVCATPALADCGDEEWGIWVGLINSKSEITYLESRASELTLQTLTAWKTVAENSGNDDRATHYSRMLKILFGKD